jgi:hypothetical protein
VSRAMLDDNNISDVKTAAAEMAGILLKEHRKRQIMEMAARGSASSRCV